MSNKLMELLKFIETLNADELYKLRTWLDFAIEKRSFFQKPVNLPHNKE